MSSEAAQGDTVSAMKTITNAIQRHNLPVQATAVQGPLHFCTYFDLNYLHRGLALYQSLLSQDTSFILWILCLDDATYRILRFLNLQFVSLIQCQDFEDGDAALAQAKGNRSTIEYYWTCTPSLPLYIFRTNPAIPLLIYVDADVFFFSSASFLLRELRDDNILIVPHDFGPGYETSTSGTYNVGIIGFRNAQPALTCLSWWRERCNEWCYWRHEDGKTGDQGYLDYWPAQFEGVVVSGNRGINAAPWNISKYQLRLDMNKGVVIGDDVLVCFHFHALKLCRWNIAFLVGGGLSLPSIARKSIYHPYLTTLSALDSDLHEYDCGISIPRTDIPWRYILGSLLKGRLPLKDFMLFPSRRLLGTTKF